MKKYENKDGKIIVATEKAFDVLYKTQGFKPSKKRANNSNSQSESVKTDGTE